MKNCIDKKIKKILYLLYNVSISYLFFSKIVKKLIIEKFKHNLINVFNRINHLLKLPINHLDQ